MVVDVCPIKLVQELGLKTGNQASHMPHECQAVVREIIPYDYSVFPSLYSISMLKFEAFQSLLLTQALLKLAARLPLGGV